MRRKSSVSELRNLPRQYLGINEENPVIFRHDIKLVCDVYGLCTREELFQCRRQSAEIDASGTNKIGLILAFCQVEIWCAE